MKKLFVLLALLAAVAAGAMVRVLESSESHILLEYSLGDFELHEAGDFLHLELTGANYEHRVGAPLLPLDEIKAALPPVGNATAVVLSSSQRSQTLSKRLLPVPELRMGESVSEYVLNVDESLYREAPKPLLEMLEPSTFRDLRFVAIHIHPFSYDGGFSLQITEQALIRIDIHGGSTQRGEAPKDELTLAFAESLVNPEHAVQFHSPVKQQIHYADFSKSDHWLRLETDRDGIFRIGPEHFTGFPLADIDPRSFRLFTNGGQLLSHGIQNPGNEFVEVPIRVVGAEDGRFDPQDYIVFYGTNRDGITKNSGLQSAPTYFNPYSGNTVWWLTFAGEFSGEPLRMQTLPGEQNWTTQTDRFSENVRVENENHRRDVIGFDWYMTRLFGNSTAEYEFQLQLANPVPEQSGLLSFSIRQEAVSSSDSLHKINIFLNDEPIYTNSGSSIFSWGGTGTYVFSRQVSNLLNGQNTLRIKVIRSSTDNLFLDWITLNYARRIYKEDAQIAVKQMELNYGNPVRYNISGNTNTKIYLVNSFTDLAMLPLQQSGSQHFFVGTGDSSTRFWLSSDSELLQPLNVAFKNPTDLTADPAHLDNIIISPDEFWAQAQTLADMYWQDYGLRSRVVNQNDIFEQFNGGHPDPVALRQYLRYVFYNHSWPRLSSVTLLGLGTIDWRNFSGQAQPKNKIITYQRDFISSDDYFVMLTQSFYPELMVGRYPASNETELAVMLSNFENYTRNLQGGWWRNSTILLGDDLYNGSSQAYENIHTRQTQKAGTFIHPSMLTDKIFAWDYPYDQFQNKPEARDDMLKAINEGRLIWYYIGHGSYDKLGSEDYFNGAADMGRFNNSGKLPFFMAASCSVSHFDYWGFESLGQKTVLMNDLGAIASYSATRLSSATQNAPMMEYVLENITKNRYPVGKSIMLAKIRHTGVGADENDATYVLFGDPHLNIVPPIRNEQMNVTSQSDAAGQDALRPRDLVTIQGSFSGSQANGIAQVKVFNTETEYDLDWQTHVSHRGAQLFSGQASVDGGSYQSSFIVPDDATQGNTGLIVSYFWDPLEKQDYTNFRHPVAYSSNAVSVENPGPPKIDLLLGSLDFRPGDTVPQNTTLYAKIEDENGINLTGQFGHGILLVLDNALQAIAVTDYFSYNLDSHTAGQLVYPLTDLSEGPHTLQLIAFDNFNLPAVASVDFTVKKTGDLTIERFLIYPNPMENDTNFTFLLSQDSELDIDIFTITGKKAHSIKTFGKQGFNSVHWDGKDGSGHRLANNTYFVKIRAKTQDLKAEALERLVIFK